VNVDWDSCLSALKDSRLVELAQWRGWSIAIVQWLHAHRLVRVFRNN
jgi:hypothetical protein